MPPSSTSSNAERAALVLLALGEPGGAGVPLREIAERLSEAKPAVHRTLMALARHGFVETVGRGRYRLGPSIYALAHQETAATEKVQRWRPILMASALQFGHCTYLVSRAGMDAVVLDLDAGTAPVRALTNGIGGRLPLGFGPGPAAILSTLDPRSREFILESNAERYRQRGIDPTVIRHIVNEAATHGYARDLGDFLPDCGGIAMPIRERDGSGSAAITVATPLSYLSPERIEDIVAFLGEAIERSH
jgi:DNA-binding IclR family transcriptional regulator